MFQLMMRVNSRATMSFVFVCFITIYVSAWDVVEFMCANGFCIYMVYHY